MCECQMLFSIAEAFVSVPSGMLSPAVAIAFVPLESLLSSSAAAAAFSVVGGGAYFSDDRVAVLADFNCWRRREENTNSRSAGILFNCNETGGRLRGLKPPLTS